MRVRMCCLCIRVRIYSLHLIYISLDPTLDAVIKMDIVIYYIWS